MMMMINWCKFITELWPLNHVKILFLLLITKMNGWNLTNSVIMLNSILTHCNTSLDFFNISESVISGRLFLSYNGPRPGHLCHTETFLVINKNTKYFYFQTALFSFSDPRKNVTHGYGTICTRRQNKTNNRVLKRQNLSSGFSDKANFKPVSSATETSQKIEISPVAS